MDQSRRVKRRTYGSVIGHDGGKARREGLLDDERQAFAVGEEDRGSSRRDSSRPLLDTDYQPPACVAVGGPLRTSD